LVVLAWMELRRSLAYCPARLGRKSAFSRDVPCTLRLQTARRLRCTR
jgi:hypothetical protein